MSAATAAARRAAISVTAALLLPLPAAADDTLTGYVKSFAIFQQDLTQSQNSLRLMWEQRGGGHGIEVHYELNPTLNSGRPAFDAAEFLVPAAWRLTDITREPASSGKHDIVQNLDRLNLQLNFEAGDLTIGRQPITFGMARVINPTDVFLPFDVRTFNTEYRVGVDAIRFQRPLGQLGEFDIGVILGDTASKQDSAAFMQLRGNVSGMDLQFALTRFAEQSMIGAGVQTALGSFGYWAEAAFVTGDQDYLRLSTGLDYAFSENTYGLVEYHYNGAGSADPANYLVNLGQVAYQRGGVFLLGEHYLIPSFSLQLSPLWSVGLTAIVNLSDNSAFVSINGVMNASQNVYLDFGFYHFVGADIVGGTAPALGSEYGASPDTLYASLRYYF